MIKHNVLKAFGKAGRNMALSTRRYRITLEQKEKLDEMIRNAEPYTEDDPAPEWYFDSKRMNATMAKSMLDNAEIIDEPPTS